MNNYQWWLIKVVALLFIPSFLFDLEIIFCLSSFIILHLIIGLKTIIMDYLQNYTLKIFLVILIRLSNLELLRYTLDFLI